MVGFKWKMTKKTPIKFKRNSTMKLTKDFKKASFVLALMILTIGIKSNDMVGSWADPYCHQFNTDGKCEICSYRYYMSHETG